MATPAEDISRALYEHLSDIIDAHLRKDDHKFAVECERLATDILLAVRRDTEEILEITGIHAHDWEYDDEPGRYRCAVCGEINER